MFRAQKVLKTTARKKCPKSTSSVQQRLFATVKQENALDSAQAAFAKETRENYHKLDKLLTDKINLAYNNNKKILPIVAEGHDKKECFPILLILIALAKKHNITNLATEMPEFILNLVLENNLKELKKYRTSSEGNIEKVVHFARSLDMKIHPVDLPLDQWQYYDNIREIFAAKEKHMATEIGKLNQDVMFIVGALHQLPLCQTTLSDSYEIVPINSMHITSDQIRAYNPSNAHLKCLDFANDPQKVTQCKINTNIWLPSRDTISQWVQAEIKQLEYELAAQEKSAKNQL